MPDGSGGFRRMRAGVGAPERETLDQLMKTVYREVHQLADGYLRYERRDHSLGATALVHEIYLRLAAQTSMDWQNRAQFLALAAQAARRVLVDHARARARKKRRFGARAELSGLADPAGPPSLDLLTLDEALARFAALHAIEAQVVEMRFFAGMSAAEVAEVLGISDRTVRRHWRYAKAWLYRELGGVALAVPGEHDP